MSPAAGRPRPSGGAGIVRTVTGDAEPSALGLVLGHEHLVARPPAIVTDDDLRLDDEDAAVREATAFARAGGGAIVEMTTVDYGRDIATLARVARAAGVHVIAATGFNQGRFADGLVARHDDDALVAWMVAEVREGALPYVPPEGAVLGPGAAAGDDDARLASRDGDGRATARGDEAAPGAADPPRAGLIKASTGPGGPSDGERRALRAAIAAHDATGAPIGTHTQKATWALEQAQAFRDGGVPPGKVLIGHLDFRPELPFLLEVAASGVFLGFDQFSKGKYLPDEERVRTIAALASEGRLEQVIVSGDLARRSYWPAYGHADAPGLAHVPRTVAAMLRAEGLSAADVDTLLRDNPQRWLAFEPR